MLKPTLNRFVKRSLLILAFGFGTTAEPVPSLDSYRIDALLAAADVACFGRVAGTTETSIQQDVIGGRTVARVTRRTRLSAARCYKGTISPRDGVEYTAHNPGISIKDVALRDGTGQQLGAVGDHRAQRAPGR